MPPAKVLGGVIISLIPRFDQIFSAVNRGDFMSNTDQDIIGMDEAGLGPLAGPMVFAAALVPGDVRLMARDSKKMSDSARFEAAVEIYAKIQYHKVLQVWPDLIDGLGAGPIWEINFLTLIMMVREKWPVCRIILDGSRKVPGPENQFIESVVKADDKYVAVSAASVLAKCSQVTAMEYLGQKYPEYEFERHHGYGSATHIEEIKKFGAVRGVHRRKYVETVAKTKGFKLHWRNGNE